ncbi:MAG TPA: type II secretion system protein [Planctomycetota bacterium]|nr:type II secretion system protein [Planctomycetota bacterium]
MAMYPAAARRRRAFTLIELLVVMSIICLLMGLVFGVATAVKRKSENLQVIALLGSLKTGVEIFQNDFRCLPWTQPSAVGPGTVIDPADVYAELRGLPGASINRTRDCLEGVSPRAIKVVNGRPRLQDPWGSDIVFRVDPRGLRPVFWSRGRDRVDDTNFEDPPASYTDYAPPPPPAAYSDPLKYPRAYFYLGDGRSRGDDKSSL